MAVPVGTISMKHGDTTGYDNGQQVRVCGTCGCVVAAEEVGRHITWHGLAAAAAFPLTVAADASVTGIPGGS
jgi:hypothetical protein